MNNLKNILKEDKGIWSIIIFLSALSLLVVYSSSTTLTFKYKEQNLFYYLFKHSSILIAGIFLILVFKNIPIYFYNKFALLFVIFSIILLFYTLIKGENINEASRWIVIPFLNLSFQTSDFAKLSLIIYVSKFIAKYLPVNNYDLKNFKKDFNILCFFTIIICGLILPTNFSTSFIILTTVILMLILSKINIKYILKFLFYMFFIFTIILGISLVFFKNKSRLYTWVNRIENFINKEKSSDLTENYQLIQAKIAIASGGIIFGKGVGGSIQRNYLPHPYSDFIFAIIIEEYGLVLGFLVILAYLGLLYSTIEIVKNSKKVFPAFLSVGLVLLLVIQAFVHIAVNVGIFPVTGQPLPLVSMGGTSIIFTSLSLGIILSVKKYLEDEQQNNSNNENIKKLKENIQNTKENNNE